MVVGLKFVPYSDDDVKWMEREDNRLEKQQTKSGVNGRLRREKREKRAWEELLAKEEISPSLSHLMILTLHMSSTSSHNHHHHPKTKWTCKLLLLMRKASMESMKATLVEL